MGNVEKYITFFSVTSLVFYFTGLIPSNGVISLLLQPQDIANSTFYAQMILGLSSITGIVIGFLSRDIVAGIMSGIVIFLSGFMLEFLVVFNKIYQVNPYIAILTYAPLTILWIITLIKFWQGTD